ncbi:glycosyltransferase family 2 protein [Proteiniphilum sp.]|uniref:glycosyltransferase family 2 protein n=1 Tax=Proteiniphilum sp. TaxID=1926877 RepID=UPI002B214BD9|nr:glycosyltransferase family 2 protein [Proteiniphilum sp.]MEA4919226.1 glycosyltransferase family 2 protein [Proteiniphilum sp.]
MIRVSVVILNWNGRKLLEQFLPSVLQHTLSEESNVVVADNASADDSLEFLRSHYPDLPVITLDKNYGFADGYNKALQQIDSEYLVLLNSDVETSSDWLQPLISYMDTHPEVAAVQPKIRSYKEKKMFEYAGAAGGFIDRYGYPFCRGRILHVVEEDHNQYNTEIPIFWATGACFCIRKKDYTEAGGLDGRFFAHMEEIDLCWRLNARGRRVMCIPDSVVYHVGGASLNQDNPKKMYLNFRNNLLMLYKNIPQRGYLSTFIIRFFFDILACIRLSLKGNFKSVWAVVDAYKDFRKMRPSYEPFRKENLRKTIIEHIPTQYRRSILMDFYFKGKKSYSAVNRGGNSITRNGS